MIAGAAVTIFSLSYDTYRRERTWLVEMSIAFEYINIKSTIAVSVGSSSASYDPGYQKGNSTSSLSAYSS